MMGLIRWVSEAAHGLSRRPRSIQTLSQHREQECTLLSIPRGCESFLILFLKIKNENETFAQSLDAYCVTGHINML